MSKTLRTIAVLATAAAVAYFSPQLSAYLVSAGLSAAAASAATAAAAFAVTTAVSYGVSALAPKPMSGTAGVTSFRQTITNTQIVYGKTRTGGLISFYHASKVGKFDYRYFVIAIAGHRINGVTGYWLNDEQVTVDGSGMVVSGKYAGNAWIWPELGSDTAVANAIFVAETGGRWTTAHRGQGIAKLYVKFKLTTEIIAENFPNITCEIEGKADIVDPRTDTEVYTTNAILCFYDWLRLSRADGGFGADADEVDDDFISAQANICDEAVPLAAGGTEPRYTCNGLITTGAAPDSVRDTLMSAFGGEFTYTGGLFKAYAAAWRPPLMSLTENDLVGGLNVSPLASGDAIGNEVRGTFNDPAQKYQPQEYPSLALTTSDDLRTIDLDLPFTKSVATCQRLAKIAVLRSAAERSVTWPMNMKGIAVEALDTVQLATSRYALSNYSWNAVGWSMGADFAVTLQLREESPDFYAWNAATDEQAPIPPADPIEVPSVIGVGTGSAPADLLATATSTSEITVEAMLPDTGSVVGYEIYRSTSALFSSATLVRSGVAGPGSSLSEVFAGLASATRYYFWVRARLGTGAYSALAGPVNDITL